MQQERASNTGAAKRGGLALLALGLIATALVLAISAPSARADTTSDEAVFLSLTNQSRASVGLPPLQIDAAASSIARSWSQYMASTGQLAHNPSLVDQINASVTTSWTRIGENVGFGGDPYSLHGAFMNSPGHRANVLGDYNRVGIGSTRDPSGRLWVTLDFIKGPPLATNDPFGSFDAGFPVLSGIRVQGWAVDPDTSASIEVHVYVDGGGTNLGPAATARPDVGAAYSAAGYGPNHGFDAVVPASAGVHQVCAYGINVGLGANRLLGCKSVTVDPSPFGSFDVGVQALGGIRVEGWAIDPDVADAAAVHVYIDGGGTNLGSAATARPDVGAAFASAGYGSNHGFDAVVSVGPGVHQVCAYAINVGLGANRLLGCRWVTVDPSPFGSLDRAQRVSAATVQVTGWTIDPDLSAPIVVHVYVDDGGTNLGKADDDRPDVGAVFVYGGWGSSHGFSGVVTVGPGVHRVCAYGINVGLGANQLLGCTLTAG
jgi:uncharacterized protein YkwD